MQIYSSPALGLDLTDSAGSMEGGGVGVRGMLPASVGQTRLVHIENWFSTLFRKPLSFTCHINSCPAVPVSDGRINLWWFCCQCTNTSTWLNCENDLLYHFGYVNECHIQAIQWSFSQLYQVSITVIVWRMQYVVTVQGFIIILLLLRYVYDDGQHARGDATRLVSVFYVLEPDERTRVTFSLWV